VSRVLYLQRLNPRVRLARYAVISQTPAAMLNYRQRVNDGETKVRQLCRFHACAALRGNLSAETRARARAINHALLRAMSFMRLVPSVNSVTLIAFLIIRLDILLIIGILGNHAAHRYSYAGERQVA